MNVIGHDHPGVHLVVSPFDAIFDGSQDQPGNGRLAEVGGATAGMIEDPVHCEECLAGGQICGWERSIRGEAAV